MKNKLLIVFACIICNQIPGSFAQDLLTKSDAVSIALEKNFDIRFAENEMIIAKNNAEITNSGYLPSLSGTVGTSATNANSELTFQNGSDTTLTGNKSSGSNASLNFNYTVFDGFGRKYNYKILQESYQLSEVQARAVMENTLINLFTGYYEIARLTENELNQEETLDISRERLKRATYSFEYGQNSQLDILNAEVDYNTDSINYLTIVQQLRNEKRNLNLLMGRDINVEFGVDTVLVFADQVQYEVLDESARINNAGLIQQEQNLKMSGYNIKVAQSALIPKIGINSSYGWNNNNFASGSFLSEQTSTSMNIGATLTWNIFDGGISNTRRQNSKIQYNNQEISLAQAKLTLERNLRNAWTIYQTALFVMEAENKNRQTNRRNFDRSKEQYELGQINSIDFRQAQFNLLNARLNYNRAKYSAKISELALMQLSGTLLTATF